MSNLHLQHKLFKNHPKKKRFLTGKKRFFAGKKRFFKKYGFPNYLFLILLIYGLVELWGPVSIKPTSMPIHAATTLLVALGIVISYNIELHPQDIQFHSHSRASLPQVQAAVW